MKALLIVDVQLDFLPGGALAISKGDEIIPLINELLTLPFDYFIATKDWHPKEHISFASTHKKKVGERVFFEEVEQILWQNHCIQGSKGAELHPLLDVKKFDTIIHKGIEKNIDSYSAFFDNDYKNTTPLDAFLKKKEIDEIFIAGLATDYCVKYSTIDALQLGYRVFVIKEACRAVNLDPMDEKNALQLMESAGAVIVTMEDVKTLVV